MRKEKATKRYKFEVPKATDATRKIEAYAAIFDTSADLGWFTEEIARGAFDKADMSAVVAIFNHDPNFPLARTTSGTLELRTDETGLHYSYDVPDTSIGRDLLVMVERGDISQSSFAFTIEKETWVEEKGKNPRRVIEKIERLYDVSPVTYPAYKETSAIARKKQEYDTPPPATGADKEYPQLIAATLILEPKKENELAMGTVALISPMKNHLEIIKAL